MSIAFKELAKKLKNLPGISKKQSEKIAYFLLVDKKNEAKELSQTIENSLANIRECEECGFISDRVECSICADDDRDPILVVVETSLEVLKFEKSENIKPHYHVLNGLIDVSKDEGIDNLNISNLESRSKKYNEVILALSPNLEGLLTAKFLKELLKNSKVTQLAQGIPLGAAMEYVDELTLKAAFNNRKEVK